MSELNLIKKLERLNQEKPNKEWVNFTRDSILLETHEQEARGASVWFNQFKRSSFMPMSLCIFLAVICGIAITIDIPNSEMQTAEIEPIIESIPELTASVVAPVIEDEPQQVAEITPETPVIEQNSSAVMIGDMNNMTKKDMEKQVEIMTRDVKECRRLEVMLTEEQKANCDEKEEQLNIFAEVLAD